MMGHISGAYTAQVSRDLALSSRFDFNIYSYDSEWTMGLEWWLRPSLSKPISNGAGDMFTVPSSSSSFAEIPTSPYGVTGVIKARASTSNVSFSFYFFFP
jgi:mitochondrial distribution and morphology protein 10